MTLGTGWYEAEPSTQVSAVLAHAPLGLRAAAATPGLGSPATTCPPGRTFAPPHMGLSCKDMGLVLGSAASRRQGPGARGANAGWAVHLSSRHWALREAP